MICTPFLVDVYKVPPTGKDLPAEWMGAHVPYMVRIHVSKMVQKALDIDTCTTTRKEITSEKSILLSLSGSTMKENSPVPSMVFITIDC